MSLQGKKKRIRLKMMGKGAKITWAENDEESEKQFRALKRLRQEYRDAGGVFKKK